MQASSAILLCLLFPVVSNWQSSQSLITEWTKVQQYGMCYSWSRNPPHIPVPHTTLCQQEAALAADQAKKDEVIRWYEITTSYVYTSLHLYITVQHNVPGLLANWITTLKCVPVFTPFPALSISLNFVTLLNPILSALVSKNLQSGRLKWNSVEYLSKSVHPRIMLIHNQTKVLLQFHFCPHFNFNLIGPNLSTSYFVN